MKIPSTESLLEQLSREPSIATLPPNQQHKALVRYQPGLDFYVERLRALGIAGLDTVLDIGCGYGQWSVAAAILNRRVIAVDHNPRGFPAVHSSARALGLDNIHFITASAEDLPLRGEAAEAVLSMEVLTFVGEVRAIGDLARVCRPGGKVVILTTGVGYFLDYLWCAFKHLDRFTFSQYLGFLGRTINYNYLGLGQRLNNMFQTRQQLSRLLSRQGMVDITFKSAGLTSEGGPDRPLRPSRFCGFNSWLVAQASRGRGSASHAYDQAPTVSYRSTRWRYLDYLAGALFCLLAIPLYGMPRVLRASLKRQAGPLPWVPTVQDVAEHAPIYLRWWRRTRQMVGGMR